MNNILEYLFVFVVVCVLDITWVVWTRAIHNLQAFRASVIAAALYTGSSISVINIVNNWWLLIPAALGAFVGTYIATKWEAKKHERFAS